MSRARGCIEANTVRKTTVFVRVVCEDDADLAVFGRGAAKGGPVGGQLSDEIDPVTACLIGCNGTLRGFVEISLALKADRA